MRILVTVRTSGSYEALERLMMSGGQCSMAETLYLDLLFLVNLSADLYLLFLTGLILKEPVRKRKSRLFFGSFSGAVLGCSLVFVPVRSVFLWKVLELILPAVLMTRIAFGNHGIRTWLRQVCILWMLALFMGGICSVLESADGMSASVSSGFWKMTSWSAGRFFPVLGIAGLCLYAAVVFLERRAVFCDNLYEVTLHDHGKQKTVRALRDTGNQLYEPYGHQPVHILEKRVCLEFCETASGVIYIPFSSVGTEAGLLPAVRMERMEIWKNEKQIRTLEQPWIAISETPLSPRHQYEMLLHGEL